MKCRSEWHTPAAAVRIRTSCGPGLLIWTSSICRGVRTSLNTAAFMTIPLLGQGLRRPLAGLARSYRRLVGARQEGAAETQFAALPSARERPRFTGHEKVPVPRLGGSQPARRLRDAVERPSAPRAGLSTRYGRRGQRAGVQLVKSIR